MQKKSVIAIALCCVAISCQQLNGAAGKPPRQLPDDTYLSRLWGIAKTVTGVAGDLGESAVYYAHGAAHEMAVKATTNVTHLKNVVTLTPEERAAHTAIAKQLQAYRELPKEIIESGSQDPRFLTAAEFNDPDFNS